MTVDLKSALHWIVSDSDESDHDLIYAAIKQRRKVLELVKSSTFRRGDRVEVVGNISPKYLKGATGVIANITPGARSAQVTFDIEQPRHVSLGKYSPRPWDLSNGKQVGTTVGIPFVCLAAR